MLFIAAGQTVVGGFLVAIGVVFAVMAEVIRARGSSADPVRHVYRAAAQRTFGAVSEAVEELGYTAERDVEDLVLRFNTGMSMKSWGGQDFTASVADLGDGSSELVLAGTRSARGVAQIQVFDWGETGQIARRVIGLVDQRLPTVS